MSGVPHLLHGGGARHGEGRVLDELAANATVAPLTRLVGGWLCKSSPQLPFRRANAALPVFGAGLDLVAAAEVLSTIEHLAAAGGRRVLIQVSSADPSAVDLDAFLAEQGYIVEAPVDLMVAEVTDVVATSTVPGQAAARTADRPVEVVVETGIDDGWASHYGDIHGDDGVWHERTSAYGEMLAVLGPAVLTGVALAPAASASAEQDLACTSVPPSPGPADAVRSGRGSGTDRSHVEVAGVGFAVLERGWAGIYGMATATEHRRSGVARSMFTGLGSHAAAGGVRRLYLQVEQDNGPAQRLCRGMGFAVHHRYHYRVDRPV